MSTLKSTVVVAALVAAASGALLAGGVPALAATTYAPYGTPTPWAPGGVDNDTNGVGGLTFYNSAGSPITHGSTNTAPFAAYAVGSRSLRSTDNLAATFLFTPQKGVDPSQWNGSVLGPSSTFPNTSAPAPVNGYTTPTTTGASNDLTLEAVSNSQTTSSDAGYANVFEIRQLTAKQRAGQSVTYNYADVLIDQNAHTWTEVWTPEQIVPSSSAVSTTSTLTSSASTVTVNTPVTLTDQVAAASGSNKPTGTVQFKDGTTNIGSQVPLDNTGTATEPFTPTTQGNHALTAVYTPSDTTQFGSSTGSVTVTANPAPKKVTQVGLIANPTSGPALSAVTLTATTTDYAGAPVDGTVTFFDGTTQIGSKATTSGSAALTYSGFTQGDHPNITAQFTPTDTTYGMSTSAAVDFNASSGPVDTKIDQQNVDAQVGAGALSITTPYHANNPLHVGTLKLNTAGTELSGSAQFGDTTSAGSIQVVDTRTGGANWTAAAASSNLVDPAGDVINQQNVGLTGLTGIYTAGNALQANSVTLTPNPAAEPPVAPAATGTQGLGGGAHAFAQTTTGGTGTVGVYGTLTVNAPTSTKAGTYAGIITFTVA